MKPADDRQVICVNHQCINTEHIADTQPECDIQALSHIHHFWHIKASQVDILIGSYPQFNPVYVYTLSECNMFHSNGTLDCEFAPVVES